MFFALNIVYDIIHFFLAVKVYRPAGEKSSTPGVKTIKTLFINSFRANKLERLFLASIFNFANELLSLRVGN
jgi:hypothetical protein